MDFSHGRILVETPVFERIHKQFKFRVRDKIHVVHAVEGFTTGGKEVADYALAANAWMDYEGAESE